MIMQWFAGRESLSANQSQEVEECFHLYLDALFLFLAKSELFAIPYIHISAMKCAYYSAIVGQH